MLTKHKINPNKVDWQLSIDNAPTDGTEIVGTYNFNETFIMYYESGKLFTGWDSYDIKIEKDSYQDLKWGYIPL
jgi:hypothetical protein